MLPATLAVAQAWVFKGRALNHPLINASMPVVGIFFVVENGGE